MAARSALDCGQIPAGSVLSAQGPFHGAALALFGVGDANEGLCRRVQSLLWSAQAKRLRVAGRVHDARKFLRFPGNWARNGCARIDGAQIQKTCTRPNTQTCCQFRWCEGQFEGPLWTRFMAVTMVESTSTEASVIHSPPERIIEDQLVDRVEFLAGTASASRPSPSACHSRRSWPLSATPTCKPPRSTPLPPASRRGSFWPACGNG